MLTYLAGDVPVNCLALNPELSANLSWEQCHMGRQDICVTKLLVSSIWNTSQFPVLPPPPGVVEETSSVSERFIRKLLLSYISLLVNSADELALARCLCLPDRGLSHKGFTALKHLAAKKQMSMFLTTFSFVFEMRREKATSESYAPLFPYSKALGEFVDLADKLMIITQDIPSVDQLFLPFASLGGFEGQRLNPVGCGGSMRGQKVIKLLRSVLDMESTKMSQNQGTEDLCDQESSQSTPVQFPSLLSQFSSPQVVDKPLDTKYKEQIENKSHYGWAAQDVTLKENNPPDAHCRESDTASDTHKPHTSNRRPIVYETLEKHHKNEQLSELTIEAPVSSSTVSEEAKTALGQGQPSTTLTAGIKVNKSKGPSLKRKKLQLEQNEKLKRARKGVSKKKTIPVSKGQKLLTNFFKTS
ncbi:PCNA-interacting partner [Holothuria leucospilota]|uniref:PCNA-interacting partner n=1 Tax=Holothuria leucospilota TaxID=206669 RepID=A0A9Q1BTX9_HOLLE|nr:PCNA-interacting partner [Holothuria leucospilota]